MRTEKVRSALISELKSSVVYLTALFFFAAGYVCRMYGSGGTPIIADLLAWYRTPLSIAVFGIPSLLIVTKTIERVIELRKLKLNNVETLEKELLHERALIEHQKHKLITELKSAQIGKQAMENERIRQSHDRQQLKIAEDRFHSAIKKYSFWANKVSQKVHKTSPTLVGKAGEQAHGQIEQLQQSVNELQKLLDKQPEYVNEHRHAADPR